MMTVYSVVQSASGHWSIHRPTAASDALAFPTLEAALAHAHQMAHNAGGGCVLVVDAAGVALRRYDVAEHRLTIR